MTRIPVTCRSMTGDLEREDADTEVVVTPVERVSDEELLEAAGVAVGYPGFH